MMRMNPVSIFRDDEPSKAFTVVLTLALMAGSLLWEGCSAVQPGAAASSTGTTTQHTVPTILPSSKVGTSYNAALSGPSGAGAPSRFALSQGELPPGLILNLQTGSISGVPTKAGTFTFTITVVDGARGLPTERVYSITISSSSTSAAISVQVTPQDPPITAGGKVQFGAVVSNTSNTAVTWSASAGTISSTGLFTAPASLSGNSITITATSAADPSVRASTTAMIAVSAFIIATTSLPQGYQATTYSTSLTASGGQPPYQWSVGSGSLPAGLQLNASTGTLSGSADTSGTFSFSVLGKDAAGHTAQRTYSLLISGSGSNCGPPTYGCSRTDGAVAQVPSPVPNVGNLVGAGTIITDPDFGNRIVRITDWNTDSGQPIQNRSYVSASSGSADENLWNIDSTKFILQNPTDQGYLYNFDPSTLQAQRMYISSFPSNGGLKLSSGGVWSRVDPNVLYTDGTNASISKYDFSDQTTPPSPQPFYDFTSSPNCLPAGFTATWKSKGGVSAGDTVFGMAYSNTGNQQTGVYAVAYKVGSGCSVLDTATGQVWGDWGVKGTINIPDRWTIHNVKISKDGNYLIVASGGCLISSCSHGPYFWQVGTTNMSSCGDGLNGGQKCGGHWTEGYNHWINNYDGGKYMMRPLASPTVLNELSPNPPPGVQDPLDQHASWNNADPADSLPFFLTYWSLTTPFPGPWYNEITGVAPDGSAKVWRFAHNFITGQSQIFSTYYGIGSVSQDGRFFIFSSDWMGTLGSQAGGSTCKVGTDCRGDVFVVELR